MNNGLESVAGYVGAKNGKAGRLISSVLYRKGITTYIEPYSGTWGVGRQSAPYPIEVWNDIDNWLYSLFSVLCDEKEARKLLNRMLQTEYSQEYFDKAKAICEKGLDLLPDRIQRAAYVWALMLQSRNGQSKVWRGLSKGNEIIKYKESLIKKYDLIGRFKNVKVFHKDALKLISKVKNRSDVMLMIDSPYVNTSRTSKKCAQTRCSEKLRSNHARQRVKQPA